MSIYENVNLTDDEDFVELALIITFSPKIEMFLNIILLTCFLFLFTSSRSISSSSQ